MNQDKTAIWNSIVQDEGSVLQAALQLYLSETYLFDQHSQYISRMGVFISIKKVKALSCIAIAHLRMSKLLYGYLVHNLVDVTSGCALGEFGVHPNPTHLAAEEYCELQLKELTRRVEWMGVILAHPQTPTRLKIILARSLLDHRHSASLLRNHSPKKVQDGSEPA